MFAVAFRRALTSTAAKPATHFGLLSSRQTISVHLHQTARRAFSVTVRVQNASPSSPSPPKADPESETDKKEQAPVSKSKSLLAMFKPEPESASSLRKIIGLAKPERRTLTIAVGLLFISSSVSMSIPFAIGKLIDFFSNADAVIPFGLSSATAAGLLLSMFTAGAIANATRAYLMKMASQRIVARLREQTYASALRQEVEFVERGEGDVLSRLGSDSTIVGESVTQNLSDGLRAIVMSSVGLGAMVYLSPTLTMLMMSVVPPISLGAVYYGRYIKKLSNSTQEAVGDMTKVAQEALSALRTVQSSNAQAHESRQFGERVKTVLALARREALASGIFFGATGWSGNVTVLVLLGYGGTLVSRGVITVGELSSMLLYTLYVGNGLSMLTSFFSSIMRGIGAGTRVFGLLSREPLIPPDTGAHIDKSRRGVLRYHNVRFEYPSRPDTRILDDFSLEIGVGESVAIVGRSGSGKSSIQSLLLRYYDPVAGHITYDGQDIREFSTQAWRGLIGLVPQDPVLFTGTIAENIAYGLDGVSRADVEHAARQANCEFIWDMPLGFDTKIGRLSLSGGQRQRLAIARALLRKPAILALDEATSALDAASELRVNDAVDRILASRDTTCVIVAHRLSTVARAERIVVLEDGRVSESGTYRELVMRENSRFRELMKAQLEAASGESALWSAAARGPDRARLQEVKEEPVVV